MEHKIYLVVLLSISLLISGFPMMVSANNVSSFQGNNVAPIEPVVESLNGAQVAILKDVDPWFHPSNELALQELGIQYDIITSNALPNVNLNAYKIIIIASDQNTAFYNVLIANRNKIINFVSNGGILVAHLTDEGWYAGHWSDYFIPMGVMHVHSTSNTIRIVVPNHPVVAGLTEADLAGWSASTHGYLTNVPQNAIVVMTDHAYRPTYIEYTYGNGVVLATMQTIEWSWRWGGEPQKNLLRNELRYAVQLTNITQALPSWLETIGGRRQDYTTDMAQLAGPLQGEDFAVTGYTKSFRSRRYDGFLYTISQNGNMNWFRVFGDRKHEYPQAVASSPTGIYVAGLTKSVGRGDAFLLKVGHDGALLWSKVLNTGRTDVIYDLLVGMFIDIPQEGETVIAVGQVNSVGGRRGQALLAMFDGNGALIWAEAFGTRVGGIAKAVTLGPDGFLYVAGLTQAGKRADAFLAKFTVGGTLIWAKAFGGNGMEDVAGVTSSNGSIYVYGYTNSFNRRGEAFVAKFDLNGNLQDFVTLFVDRRTRAFGGDSGSIYVVGSTMKNRGSFIVKLDENLNLEMVRSLKGARKSAFKAAEASDGALFLAGDIYYGAGRGDVFMACLSPTGKIGTYQWTGGEAWRLSMEQGGSLLRHRAVTQYDPGFTILDIMPQVEDWPVAFNPVDPEVHMAELP